MPNHLNTHLFRRNGGRDLTVLNIHFRMLTKSLRRSRLVRYHGVRRRSPNRRRSGRRRNGTRTRFWICHSFTLNLNRYVGVFRCVIFVRGVEVWGDSQRGFALLTGEGDLGAGTGEDPDVMCLFYPRVYVVFSTVVSPETLTVEGTKVIVWRAGEFFECTYMWYLIFSSV